MIDPKLLRQDAAGVAANLARRGFEFDSDAYLALEEQRKALQVETEELRNERNTSSKNIGKAKAQGEDIAPLLAAVKDLGDKLLELIFRSSVIPVRSIWATSVGRAGKSCTSCGRPARTWAGRCSRA